VAADAAAELPTPGGNPPVPAGCLGGVEDFRAYMASRLEVLRRTAYLLCGDWHRADDLVSTALMKMYGHWSRVSTMDNIDAYARRTLLRTWLNERRRGWRREVPAGAELPDAAHGGHERGVTDRLTVVAALAELSPKRRAVIVLRYFCDLSVEQTAEILGCSTGTVKSQTARSLDALRAHLAPDDVTVGGQDK
jgi:RNA polymerase sigma-70 factor (sigma-E family)